MSGGNITKLEGINKVLRFTSIFWCVGILLFLISFIGINYLPSMRMSKTPLLLMAIGWGIIGLPKIIAVLFGGIGDALFGPLKADYAVVTVDGLGRTISSDGGAQSITTNFIGRIVQLIVIYIIGGFVTIIHLIILSIMYVITSIAAKEKSTVVPNGFIIILINIAAFVVGVIIAALIQQVAWAQEERISAANAIERGVATTGDFQHALNKRKDGIIIEKYTGKGSIVVIPDEFNGIPVVGIDNWGLSIFDDSAKITQITLPKTLKTIGSVVFSGSKITSIIIPEGVTDIGTSAFLDCANLTSVTFPRSLERIGTKSFGNCTSLVDVIIPSGSTIMYGSYLRGNTGMPNAIPVEDMGHAAYFNEKQEEWDHTFEGCSNLSAASQQAIRNSGYTGDF